MGWLVCFYIGYSTELDLILKKLPNIINTINLGIISHIYCFIFHISIDYFSTYLKFISYL